MYKQVKGKRVKMTVKEIDALELSRKPNKNNLKSQLWQSCNNYQASKISVGGMIELKSSEKTSAKCKAIRTWIKDLWTDYYMRKGLIDQGLPTSFDFRDHGELPFSYIEAATEAGVI